MYEEQNKNGLPHNKTQKKISFAKIAGSAALAFCLTASLGLNIYQLKESAKQSKKLNKFIDGQLERQAKEAETKNLYQEDGFLIGNEYEIRSTKVVSDAYLKGDDSNLKEEDKQTLKMASAILNKIIKNGMNNYEKELAVYNWMYQNIKQGSGSTVQLPGTSRNAYTPYHVLNGKNAVCVGYATTFRLFMNMLGMDCHIVHNDYHSWDLVQLDDQEWYQVDIYTDVSGNSKYQNFNISDEVARNSHEWDDSSLPEAKGVKYSYAVQNSRKIHDIYAIPAKIKKILDQKKNAAFYKFEKPLTQEQLPVADLLINQLNAALTSMPGFETYTMTGVWFTDIDHTYILGIYITNYSETPSTTYDENSVEYKKMRKSISKAFDIENPNAAEGKNDEKEIKNTDSVRSNTENNLPRVI